MTKTDVENDKVENLNTYFLFHSQMVQIKENNVSLSKCYLDKSFYYCTVLPWLAVSINIQVFKQ